MAKKITFTLAAEIAAEATEGLLLGDFNNWDINSGSSLKKQKDGSLKATLSLEPGKTYQYRYLLNDGRWVNDGKADNYVHVSGFHVENCQITIPAETKKAAKVKVVEKDDLTRIEGIGEKISGLLAAEKILTFEDLSKATVKKLKGILEAGGNKFEMHNPSSWAKQAKLAAAGKWAELDNLQAQLNAGK